MSGKNLNKAAIISSFASHEAILQEFGESRIGLFGSYLHDKQKTEMDGVDNKYTS